jgi:hypothetical protein
LLSPAWTRVSTNLNLAKGYRLFQTRLQ